VKRGRKRINLKYRNKSVAECYEINEGEAPPRGRPKHPPKARKFSAKKKKSPRMESTVIQANPPHASHLETEGVEPSLPALPLHQEDSMDPGTVLIPSTSNPNIMVRLTVKEVTTLPPTTKKKSLSREYKELEDAARGNHRKTRSSNRE
jgi:hypothetical protein